MKLIQLDSYKNNKRKTILTIIAIIVILLIISFIIVYVVNKDARDWIDRYILRKEISYDNLPSISLNAGETEYIYAYDKYIVVLNKNVLYTHNFLGNKVHESDVYISNPIFKANNRFLVTAEQNGQKVYLISGSNIIWQVEVEGQISKVSVNKNGYVAVVVTGTGYKAVVITFDAKGKELFKTYLSSTTAMSVEISNDNKYLAIAEIDTSGTLIQSNVKLISIETASRDPNNSLVYTYNADSDKLVTDIKYQDKSKLVCMYNDSVQVIQNETAETLLDISDKKIISTDINLTNYMVRVTEISVGLFSSNTELLIKNVQNQNENTYTIEGIAKQVYAYDGTIAVNLGTEIHFVNTNGWLIKKYTSSQEIKDILLGSSIAGIVYRDKIEIVGL